MDRRQRNAERARLSRKVRRERESKLQRFHEFVRDNYPQLFSEFEKVFEAKKKDLVPYQYPTETLAELEHGCTFASGVSNDYPVPGEPKYGIKLDDGTALYNVGYITFEQPKEQSSPDDQQGVITLAGCKEAPKTESSRVIEILDD